MTETTYRPVYYCIVYQWTSYKLNTITELVLVRVTRAHVFDKNNYHKILATHKVTHRIQLDLLCVCVCVRCVRNWMRLYDKTSILRTAIKTTIRIDTHKNSIRNKTINSELSWYGHWITPIPIPTPIYSIPNKSWWHFIFETIRFTSLSFTYHIKTHQTADGSTYFPVICWSTTESIRFVCSSIIYRTFPRECTASDSQRSVELDFIIWIQRIITENVYFVISPIHIVKKFHFVVDAIGSTKKKCKHTIDMNVIRIDIYCV